MKEPAKTGVTAEDCEQASAEVARLRERLRGAEARLTQSMKMQGTSRFNRELLESRKYECETLTVLLSKTLEVEAWRFREYAKTLKPAAEKHRKQVEVCRAAQRKSVAVRARTKPTVDKFIRQRYRTLLPDIEAGRMSVKEAYGIIQEQLGAKFHAPTSELDPLRVSSSRIARALGKKK